jgi:hypothetical protein
MTDIEEIYYSLQDFVEKDLRTADNAQLALQPMNSIYETGDSVQIDLVNVKALDPVRVGRQLEQFRKGTTIYCEENHMGTMRWIVTVPIYERNERSGRHRNRRRRHHSTSVEWSTEWFLGYLLALMVLIFIGAFIVPARDWNFIMPK